VEGIRKETVAISSNELPTFFPGEMINSTNEGLLRSCQQGTELRMWHVMIRGRRANDAFASCSRTNPLLIHSGNTKRELFLQSAIISLHKCLEYFP